MPQNISNEEYRQREYDKYVSLMEEHAYKIIDDGYLLSLGKDKKSAHVIDLTLMAITHGDEVAGMSVLNEVLTFIKAGFQGTGNIAFVLANRQAMQQGKRFLERDLNRQFNRYERDTHEGIRAKEIAKVLAKTRYFIDFHQTTLDCSDSFAIFPFSPLNVSWARKVLPKKPIVTRFGEGFSANGMCSDEYVLQQGGVGITVELGKKGFYEQQVSQGVLTALRGLCFLNDGKSLSSSAGVELYTFSQTIRKPALKSEVQLYDGLYNFKPLHKGEKIAEIDGEAIFCENDGYALFPKYEQHSASYEVCHVLCKSFYEKYPVSN